MAVREEFLAFFDQLRSEDEIEEGVAEGLLALASEHEEVFRALVRDVPGTDSAFFENLTWVFSASPDASRWQHFIVALLDRLLGEAEAVVEPLDVLESTLEFFSFDNDERDDLDGIRRGLREVCLKRFQSSTAPQVRQCAMVFFGHFTCPEDTEAVGVLEELRRAPDWGTRYFAYTTLNDLNDRPLTQGIPLLDRIRALIFTTAAPV